MAPLAVTVACEGDTDVPVLRRVLEVVGIALGDVHVKNGKSNLDRSMKGFNNAATLSPWVVLRDLDQDARCAGELVAALLPDPAVHMRFRIAVRSVEAWLMADRDRFAKFLGVPVTRVPRRPETEPDPKKKVVSLASRSRSKEIRESVVPAPGMSARVGPGYTEKIMSFAGKSWRPEVAATNAPSLARCLERLRGWGSAEEA